jgi:hypothetical protein
LHHLAGRGGIGDIEVARRLTAAERLVRAEVLQDDLSPNPDVSEVNNHIGALSQPHEELLEPDRGGQETTLGADLPER